MNNKLKVGMIGIGAMGRGHLDQYLRLMAEGYPVELVAICDIDEKKFKGEFIPGNIDNVGVGKYNFDAYRLYTDIDAMLAAEQLDYVDIALPTYLHAEVSIKAMERGLNVLCEKPMALTPEQCDAMIAAQQRTGKTLMIAQCLRFWPAYMTLKQYVDEGTFGKVVSAYFFRGGSTPKWSYEDWLIKEEKSGGCILDQHVHDVDTINWIFGAPEAVSTQAVNCIAGSGYDAVSTHYRYPGQVFINAQDDWYMNGKMPFQMTFRVNFEGGTLVLAAGKLTIYPVGGEPFEPDITQEDGYYNEVRYFIQCLRAGEQPCRATLQSTRQTICIATAERASAARRGDWVPVQV